MKKLLSLLISLSVILTCMSGISLVASADTTLAGSGTEADPYIIDSADKFVAVFGDGNTNTAATHADGVTYLLTADIDLRDKAYKPATVLFQGNLWGALDGETKHKITVASAFTNTETDYHAPSTIQYVGSLFHNVENVEIKNLEIYGTASTAITGNGYYGVVAGQAKTSTIKNVNNYVDVTGGQKNGTAGIVGTTNNATIENCINYGDITATESNANYTSGIAADIIATTVSNCMNEGTVSGPSYSGGISSNAKKSTAEITNCVNKGNVTATSGAAAGILALSKFDSNGEVSLCKNYGEITGVKYAAGIVAEQNTNSSEILSCENYGKINSDTNNSAYYAAGIVALSLSDVTSCYNYGVINSKNRAGGIVGMQNKSGTISKCANLVDITLPEDTKGIQVGGIVGNIIKDDSVVINIEKCYNKGDLTAVKTFSGAQYVGSMLGWAQANTTVNVINCYNLGELVGFGKGIVGQLSSSKVTVSTYYDLGNSFKNTNVQNGTAKVASNETKLYNNTNETDIMALTDDTVWVAQEGYKYPSLKDNQYKSNLVGLGNETSPYRIYSAGDLKLVSTKPAAYYKQMLDITGMDTILCTETAFSGTYDGNNKKIDLAIDESKVTTGAGRLVGLFKECASPAVLKNIITTGYVKAGWINYQGGAGVLTGKATSTTVQNCKNYASLDVHGYRAGGFIGLTSGTTTITNCYNYGNIYATDEASGIVANLSDNTTIKNCGNYGNISSILTASGIGHYNYSTKTIENVFNIGTITATNKEKGVACGLFAAVQNRDGLIKNCFNAGGLCATTSFGIAHSNATTASNRNNTWNVENCYNASYATYPVAGNLGTITLNITNCYYLADADTDGLDNTTAVTPANLITEALGDAFSIVNDYKYPQLTANTLDPDYDNIDFYLVTVNNLSENGTELSLNTGKAGSFYLPTGTELKIDAIVSDADFYEAYVNGAKVTDTLAYTINANTDISFTDKAIEAEVPSVISTPSYTFGGEEAVTVDGKTYNDYALAAAKAVKVPGLKRIGFGIYFGKTAESCTEEFAGENTRISSDGSFGILICNEEGSNALQAGATYYFKPYVKYQDIDGNVTTVCGDVDDFTYNVIQ